MPQIDLTLPKNALDKETRGQLLTDLTAALHKWEGVPPTSPTAPWAWAFIHEMNEGDWSYGGKVATAEDKPRYRVLITVPEGVMDNEHKAGLVAEVTQILTDSAGPDAEKSGLPLVTCLVLDVPDGGYGVAGRVFHLPKAAS